MHLLALFSHSFCKAVCCGTQHDAQNLGADSTASPRLGGSGEMSLGPDLGGLGGLSPTAVSADEHVTAGQHRHAQLSAPAALHQDLPGATRPARVPWLAQRPAPGPPHLDLQPQRHPHGPRWQGAPLRGLGEAA